MKNTLAVLLLAMILLSTCLWAGCGAHDNIPDSKNEIQRRFDELDVSTLRSFDFTNDLCGWQTYAANDCNHVSWIESGKTGLPCVKMTVSDSSSDDSFPNAALYRKFSLASKDKLLVLDANIIGNSPTSLRVVVADSESENVLTAESKFLQTDENGYYKLTSASQTVFVFDLSKYAGKTMIIAIETDSLCSDGQSGVFINSIDIVETYTDVSQSITWSGTQLACDWQLRGDITVENNLVKISGGCSSIYNDVYVSAENPYLKVGVSNNSFDLPIELLVNKRLIDPINRDEFSDTLRTPVPLIYDLTAYIDSAVSLEIQSTEAVTAIDEIAFMPNRLICSTKSSWTAEELFQSWLCQGKVEQHDEGTCLEYSAEGTSITNIVKIDSEHCYLNIRFRKFVRPEGQAQDIDPKICVYADDMLIRAIDAVDDFVTVTTDDYIVFRYDLTQFVGQDVTIRIENKAGPHACFDRVFFDSEPNAEPGCYGQYSADDLKSLPLSTKRSWSNYDLADWQAGCGEKEYDNIDLIYADGRMSVYFEGSDLGASDTMPNAWIYNKLELDQGDTYLQLNICSADDADTNLRVRVLFEQNGEIVTEYLTACSYSQYVDEDGYTVLNNESPKTISYDLANYSGRTVIISIEQDDNGQGAGEYLKLYEIKIMKSI